MERLVSLEIFAEIGIALAGFSGVAAAVAGRSPAGMLPRQRPGFWSVISIGFMLAILALVPRAIASYGVSEPIVWRTVCVVAVPFFVVPWLVLWRYHQRLDQAGHPSTSPWVYPVAGAIMAIVAASLLLGAAGVFPSFSVYYSSLVVLIGFAAQSFVLFLLVPQK